MSISWRQSEPELMEQFSEKKDKFNRKIVKYKTQREFEECS